MLSANNPLSENTETSGYVDQFLNENKEYLKACGENDIDSEDDDDDEDDSDIDASSSDCSSA